MYTVTSTAGYFATKKIHSRGGRLVKRDRILIDPASYTAGKEVKINVSGSRFRIHESYLNRHPSTLLGSSERNFFYDDRSREFFFDRDPYIFRFIHKYYKTGKLHFSEHDCCEAFLKELKFFRIDPKQISTCCIETYEMYLMKIEKRKGKLSHRLIKMPMSAKNSFRAACWKFTETPSSSIPAKFFNVISCLVIVLSVTTNCIETVDCDVINGVNVKCGAAFQFMFFAFDSACAGFFTLEFLLRLYGTPDRVKFLKLKMSIIDLMAILPYFLDLVLAELHLGEADSTVSNMLIALRTLRIVRVFKLVRHSKRLRNLSVAIGRSLKDLGFILFVYVVMVIIFASIIYYAERMTKSSTKLKNIPEAMWYTVVTTTTLGYGDIVPATIQGKFLGSMCCLMGVFMVALPVPIIQMKTEDEDMDGEDSWLAEKCEITDNKKSWCLAGK